MAGEEKETQGNKRLKNLLKKTSGQQIGLFIDNANWFYPQRELGWDIDFGKLVKFLKTHYQIKLLKLYTGTPLDLVQKRRFQKFVDVLRKFGFLVETKPLKKIWVDRKKKEFIYKCNFDVEISLDAARHIKELDMVIIGSGDSDFLAIKSFSQENKKGFMALCFEKGVAWEIRKCYHIFLEDIKERIREKKQSFSKE